MAHYYFLRPSPVVVAEGSPEEEVPEDIPEESTPVVLQIYTDDDGLILRLAPPEYRAGDAAMKQLMSDWQAYAAAAVGSPEEEPAIHNMELFQTFLVAMYPTTYKLTQKY